MTTPQASAKACHNCRRQRLKCDRSLPQCSKCTKRGQECLGYQQLLRWGQGVASRGKMTGMTFEAMNDRGRHEDSSAHSIRPSDISKLQISTRASPVGCLTDPLIQDMGHASRKYLSYFASDVCKDLVLYDVLIHNPFRDLIPATSQHPALLHVILANAALHMSNAYRRSLGFDSSTLSSYCYMSLANQQRPSSFAGQRLESYSDALLAKQQALRLLKATLACPDSADIDVTLAVVLLFIEFELIDSGRDDWRCQFNGARTIIETRCRPNLSTQSVMSSLRKFLISNCLVFDILGSTLAYPKEPIPNDTLSTDTLSLLQDAEGNHCSSFPVVLLQLIRAGAHLSQSSEHTFIPHASTNSKEEQVLGLLYAARSFDPLTWATDLQPRSPAADLQHRMHIASAHRAAVCIYLSRILLSFHPSTTCISCDLESLVAETVSHLSSFDPTDALFTATTWPAFIAGAETSDNATQEWVARRFQELWEVEPWGLLQGALGVLEKIWSERSEKALNKGRAVLERTDLEVDWIEHMREEGVDWLII